MCIDSGTMAAEVYWVALLLHHRQAHICVRKVESQEAEVSLLRCVVKMSW
jgi:hypothetical protein